MSTILAYVTMSGRLKYENLAYQNSVGFDLLLWITQHLSRYHCNKNTSCLKTKLDFKHGINF